MSTDENRNLRDGFGLSVYLSTKLGFKTSIIKAMIKRGSVTINGIVVTNTRHPVYADDMIVVNGKII